MAKRAIRLTTEAFTSRPALDTAVSRAVLQQASDGAQPETLRLFRPADIVAFGPQDTRTEGYRQAVEAARIKGFEAIQRMSGGRAAVFHDATIAFAWAIPDPHPRTGVEARFQELADIMVSAFRRLGVDARIGEVPGEYCPGRYSVNARGETKLMGVGQRVIFRAAHVGGVVVVGGGQRIRDVLTPVYQALGLDWDPDTVGSLEDETGPIDYGTALQAVLDEFASRYDLYEEALDADILALARKLEHEHDALHVDGR